MSPDRAELDQKRLTIDGILPLAPLPMALWVLLNAIGPTLSRWGFLGLQALPEIQGKFIASLDSLLANNRAQLLLTQPNEAAVMINKHKNPSKPSSFNHVFI